MPTYVTLEQVKGHLRKTTVIGDDTIDLYIESAEALILNYLKTAPDSSAATMAIIRQAVLIQVAEFWRFRGDEINGQGPAIESGQLSPTVTNLLRRFRDPALA